MFLVVRKFFWWWESFFYLFELLLESPRAAAHVLAASGLGCGGLGGPALGEVGHVDWGAGQVGQEGVGVAGLPAERLQGRETLKAPQVVQVQVHLGNGVGRQKVAADPDGGDLHLWVLLLFRVFSLLPVLGLVMVTMVVAKVRSTVRSRTFGLWLGNCTPRRLKQNY